MNKSINRRKSGSLISGLVLILINAYWIYYNVHFYYLYHYTGILFLFKIPDWVLILNTTLGIVGIVIGISIIKQKLKARKGVIIDLALIISGILIENIYSG